MKSVEWATRTVADLAQLVERAERRHSQQNREHLTKVR